MSCICSLAEVKQSLQPHTFQREWIFQGTWLKTLTHFWDFLAVLSQIHRNVSTQYLSVRKLSEEMHPLLHIRRERLNGPHCHRVKEHERTLETRAYSGSIHFPWTQPKANQYFYATPRTTPFIFLGFNFLCLVKNSNNIKIKIKNTPKISYSLHFIM